MIKTIDYNVHLQLKGVFRCVYISHMTRLIDHCYNILYTWTKVDVTGKVYIYVDSDVAV